MTITGIYSGNRVAVHLDPPQTAVRIVAPSGLVMAEHAIREFGDVQLEGSTLSVGKARIIVDEEAVSEATRLVAVARVKPPQSQPQPARRTSSAADRAHKAAKAVEILAWITFALSLLGGAVLALTSEVDRFSGATHYPYIGLAAGIAAGGTVQSLFVVMIAAYVRYRTENPR